MRASMIYPALVLAGLTAAVPHPWPTTYESGPSNVPPRDVKAIPHHKRTIIQGPGGYDFNVLEHLAGISPYFDSPGVQVNPSPPEGCKVSKASYLVRHSNIYANDYDYETYLQPFLSKLSNFSNKGAFAQTPDSRLHFLANYTSPITNETEQLEKVTPSGRQAAEAFGGSISNLYPDLLTGGQSSSDENDGKFRVWAASASRCVDSASSFINGAFRDGDDTVKLVQVYEGENDSADSLAPHESCPAFDASLGSHQSRAWVTKYTAPILSRLNGAIPEFNFTANDVYAMQELCEYDDVIRNRTEFCDAFSAQEWLDFEYSNDLMYFYSIGYGNPIGAQLGLPWARSALDILNSGNDTSTFNQSLYVSFTHREEPPLVLTALGLFNNSAFYPGLDVNSTMPADEINYAREWRASRILPFLGHVGLERMDCTNASSASPDSYVRVLVNSAPIPIPGCQDGPGDSCGLNDFGDYMQERATLYGDFIGACQINETVTNRTNSLSIYSS